MSLRHASRVLLRAAQAVARARLQPATASKSAMPPAAGALKPPVSGAALQPQQATRRLSGGLADASTQRAKTIRRRAEKSENVMHLVCWGPN
ncbi:uncharacterized protein LOC125534408 [Triticum urartu]|uniref:uncharacterized protein LOC125534408 n=1 Tax=Triticum urartu TaxID=4572 RepID=UPI002043F5AE|nr:uncharacterized protein LOC125534408 [Triticum urartu]